MVLIGTTSLSRTLDAGDFFCPTCHGQQPYRQCGVRVWITLYFIPVAPISRPEIHIRCGGCQSKWDPSVLTMDDQTESLARRDQFAAELLRACILAIQLAGEVTEDDVEQLARISAQTNASPLGLIGGDEFELSQMERQTQMERQAQMGLQEPIAGDAIGRDQLGMLCSAAKASGIRAGDYLLTVCRPWNHSQRVEALGHLFAAVSASGTLSPQQSELLKRLKDIFDLTDREYRDAIETVATG